MPTSFLSCANSGSPSVLKVKSHQDPSDAKNFSQLWDILGNACVDRGATAALRNLPSSILQLHHKEQKDWVIRERNWLLGVFKYVVALNRARIHALDQCQKQADSLSDEVPVPVGHVPKHLTGNDAFQRLTNFSPHVYTALCSEWSIPDGETLQLFMQDATVAYALLQWSQLLRWPPALQEDYLCDDVRLWIHGKTG